MAVRAAVRHAHWIIDVCGCGHLYGEHAEPGWNHMAMRANDQPCSICTCAAFACTGQTREGQP